MTIRAILWTYKPRQDGQCNVKIYVHTEGGQKKYFKTDIHVDPSDWDEKKGLVKKNHQLFQILNSKIQKELADHARHFHTGGTFSGRNNSLIELIRQYIEEVENGIHSIRLSTTKIYKNTLKKLTSYAKGKGKADFLFDDVSMDFHHDFSTYLNKTGCNQPGIYKHMKTIKKFMNEGLTRGLHTNTVHQKPSFKAPKEKAANKIYLTEAEIEKLADLDLSGNPSLERERDRFLVSYWFVMRHSDSIKVREMNFFQRDDRYYYRSIAQKNDREIVLPVKPDALAILKRRNFNLSGDTNQEANRKLKTIAAMAGIDEMVSEGKKTGPKWGFVTTHTARRSAATNLYLQGVSLKMIADLGGWGDEGTLRVYLRASGLDTALVAKDLGFFR
ncbi:MAG TPA: site-specific integrase [Flavilitoribacter sp.]|nr:site-specific integrase [Flavilitoribacter sp.]